MASQFEIARAAAPELPRKPDYDDMDESAFEAWWAARSARLDCGVPDKAGMNRFFQASAETILGQAEGANRLYSPLNLWFALHLLSHVSAGNGQAQVIAALSAENRDALDEQAAALWLSQHWDDGESACVPGSSLWLAEDIRLPDETLERLANTARASVFRGEMGSPALDQALQAWLNRQTAGLLSGPVDDMRLEKELRMAIFTTLYFRSNWEDPFSPEANTQETFHALAGDVTREFMHWNEADAVYYGAGFSAFIKRMNEGKVIFLLPEEGVSPEALFQDENTLSFLTGGYAEAKCDYALVRFSMPKLDCFDSFSLKDCMRALGVTELFDPALADFSAVLEAGDEAFISDARQCVRVLMDEEGVAAAAITEMLMATTAMPPEQEIDFCLNRPFAFAIMGQQDVPLFLGVIHQP